MRQLSASFRTAPAGQRVGDVDDADPIRLTVVLKPGEPIKTAPAAGGILSHAQYQAQHGTPDAVLQQVAAYATSHGLRVVEASSAKHAVRLEGTVGQARAAFQPDGLGVWRIDGEDVVSREGHLSVPDALSSQIVAVLGFDERPIAKAHFRVAPAAMSAGYTPVEVARRYRFPPNLDGAGQTIALVELGGGYDPADVAAYFAEQGINRTGKLVAVGVDGVNNAPEGTPNGADGEVQLDIEVAGSVAPAADIVVYFGSNRSIGFLDTLQVAIDDRTHLPSVVSISWGAPETVFSQQDMLAMDQAMQSAAALGITVCCASGDNGAEDGVGDGGLHVDFPASSPHALGCGGTNLPRTGAEVAWNGGIQGGASGGGFSSFFPKPQWQADVPGARRGVPDVAGDADPATGYRVRVDGVPAVVGGTSAVAPLWAALIALCNQSLGRRVGFANPTLYRNAAACTDITTGDNGGFNAAVGWDPVTGLGSPIGTAVLTAFETIPTS